MPILVLMPEPVLMGKAYIYKYRYMVAVIYRKTYSPSAKSKTLSSSVEQNHAPILCNDMRIGT